MMATFKVIQPVQHDGKKLHVGDSIELPLEDSEALLKLGAIEPAQELIAPVVSEQTVTTKTAKTELPKT